MRRTGIRAAGGVAAALLLTGCAQAQPTSVGGADAVSGWTALPVSPLSARQGAVAEWVEDRYVVVGGSSGPSCPPNASCLATPELFLKDGATFDPTSGEWAPIADAPLRISSYRTAVVGDGLYLLDVPDPTKPDEVLLRYDVGDDAWTRLATPPAGVGELVAAGDRLLAIAGTDELGEVHDAVYDADADAWSRLPDDPLGPSFNRGALWLGDRLLLTAQDLVPNPGAEEPSLTRLAVLDGDLRTWQVLPDSPIIGGAPLLAGGLVVFPGLGGADGGEIGNWGREYPYGGILDPDTGTWTDLPQDDPTSSGLTPIGADGVLADGRVLSGSRILDVAAGTWSALPEPPLSERDAPITAVGPDSVLVWGGTAPDWTRNVDDGALLRL